MIVLGLIDSFKGTLSSIELGNILCKELMKKNIAIDYCPISDGGDGFLDVIEYNLLVQKSFIYTVDSLNRRIKTYYLYDKLTNTAYIELAKTAGLSLLNKDEYNPFITSTYGTGIIISAAIKKGIKNIVIGIGGTSTNDGGSGILEALGVKFFDNDDNLLKFMNNEKLKKIKRIDTHEFDLKIKDLKIQIISDVQNILLGKSGATYVYSLQKGAKVSDLEPLEANLAFYSNLIETYKCKNFKDILGSGAAGGVGFAFLAMFGAELRSGIDYILDLIMFDEYKTHYDFIITGEGKIDQQSLAGKVVFEVIKRAYPVKVITLAAINELSEADMIKYGAYKSYSIVDRHASIEESLNYPKKYFRKLVREIKFYE